MGTIGQAGSAEGPDCRPTAVPSTGTVSGGGGLGQGIAAWAGRGMDLLFPPRCPICRREPAGQPPPQRWGLHGRSSRSPEGQVCRECRVALCDDVIRCRRCGGPARPAGGCGECCLRPCGWRNIAVLAGYQDALREAVLRAKRPAGEEVVSVLAALLCATHGAAIASWGIDRVVPVPMHWRRRLMRGTSAAEGLARALAADLRLPWSRELRRWRATPMQNELPAELRPGNVRDAFRARRRLPGARILLVDDVLTTGATLSACARVLLEGGAASVDVAVVARADRGTPLADVTIHAP